MFQLNKNIKKNRGMTYLELIAVLSIFAILSSVVLFDYNKFQAKVDIKNLANDIALKIVEAQKASFSGKLPSTTQAIPFSWKPSYGVYFDTSDTTGSKKDFIYFTDLDQSGDYSYNGFPETSFCSSLGDDGECLGKINITKNNYISDITVFYQDGSEAPPISSLSITFIRPNSEAIIKSSFSFSLAVSYVQITISSPSGIVAKIKMFSSGRIQIS